jgi:hypothetical protein
VFFLVLRLLRLRPHLRAELLEGRQTFGAGLQRLRLCSDSLFAQSLASKAILTQRRNCRFVILDRHAPFAGAFLFGS